MIVRHTWNPQDLTLWLITFDKQSKPSMIIYSSLTKIKVHAYVPPKYVPKMRADVWCRETVEIKGGTAGGSKDGTKGIGTAKNSVREDCNSSQLFSEWLNYEENLMEQKANELALKFFS